MIELKPCPFCGENITHYSTEMSGYVCIKLETRCKCGAEFIIKPNYILDDGFFKKVQRFFPYGDAIKIWNRRADNA